MLFENRQTFITVMKLLSVHFLAEIQTASLSRPRPVEHVYPAADAKSNQLIE
jgi:hypothetical protein